MEEIVNVFLLWILTGIPNYQQYIKDVPGLDRYPNAAAINVLTEVTVDIRDDTTYTYDVFYIKKILTYKGKIRYSDVDLLYDANHETVELGECFTVDPGGKKVVVPSEAFHDQEHYLTLSSPEYVNIRQKTVNFPAVEPGYFVVVHYSRTNKRKEFVDGVEHMMEANPYLKKRFTIKCPDQMKLHYDYNEEELTFNVGKRDGKTVYCWEIENSSLIPLESNSPSYLYSGCPVAYSTATWVEMGGCFLEKLKRGIKGNKDITRKSKKVTKGAKSQRDKLFRIYDYIANNFTEKPSVISKQDFTPLTLEKVYRQKYGCARDLVALFIFMAESAGVKDCVPVIVLNPGERFSPYQSNNAAKSFMSDIMVFAGGNLISPGNDHLRFGYAGIEECNLILGSNPTEFFDYKYQTSLLSDRKIRCSLNGSDVTIAYENSCFGRNDEEYRKEFRNETKQNRKMQFSNQLEDRSAMISEGPYFENIEKLDNTLIIKYTCEHKGFTTDQGKFTYLRLPGEEVPIRCGATERKNPFEVSAPFVIREEFFIENLPKDFQMISPENESRTYTIGDYKITYGLDVQKGKKGISLTRKISIPQGIIYPDHYEEFRKAVGELKLPQNLMVFGTKG
jgi:hypothetical protein